ncbi:hypothetical protein BRETT_004965 [Brettanomyces bruxellensis]|uniref:Nucleolar pre-ribosomal-associated protein 1 n=1 Tax=Dekkera bruxellensis TaxID=5007 RepID=A0A871RCK0_DEKBR|nr:uncharacterized protein BRETT_004965 [Brettanomyces bruxellensis]QOU20311.1 hypothetical protein BRETT_004965 [Brettanomyces bruxellensis]
MAKEKDPKYVANSADVGVRDEFCALVSKLDLDSGETEHDELQSAVDELKAFLDKGFNLTSIAQSFSYASTVNDNRTLTYLTSALSKVIDFSNGKEELSESVSGLIDQILGHIGVFHRSLSSFRPNIVNPMLKLMISIIAFDKGSRLDKFLDSFDLTLKSLPKLAIPSKTESLEPAMCQSDASVRHNFVSFWLAFCQAVTPLTRKDILTTNSRVMSNIFRYIAGFDSPDLQHSVLEFMDTCVLMEPSYKKMTKCRIVGDWVITKLVELYSIKRLRKELQLLLLKMCTDEADGLVFRDDKAWFSDDSAGAVVTVGAKQFKVHNKLIFTMLVKLQPCVDDLQLDLVVRVLEHIPELVPAYNYYCFFTNGAHDPKLTSFYVGQSLLLLKLVQLPVPAQFLKTIKKKIQSETDVRATANSENSNVLLWNIAEAICPSQLTRAAFVNGLGSDSALIVHINLVLMVAILQKYQQFSLILSYDSNQSYSKIGLELTEILKSQKFPPLDVLGRKINELLSSGKESQNVLLLNAFKVAEYYNEVFGESANVRLHSFDLTQPDKQFKGLDMAILSSYLRLSAGSPEQCSWWKREKNASNTLFTALLTLPCHHAAISVSDIVSVVSSLTSDTLMFSGFRDANNKVLCSQVYALVLSLKRLSVLHGSEEVQGVCHVIDESVSRCVQSPYKYVDQAAKYNSGLSPLFVVLLEQSKYYQGDSSLLFEWIQLVVRYLFLLGEPLSAMKQCLAEYWPKEVSITLDLAKYEASLHEFCSKYSKTELSGSVIENPTDNLLDIPFSELSSHISAVIPTADFDAVCLLIRCHSIVVSEDISYKKAETLLSKILSKLGSYILQKIDDIVSRSKAEGVPLLSSKYWRPLFVGSADLSSSHGENPVLRKRMLTSALLNEVMVAVSAQISNSGTQCDLLSDYSSAIFALLTSLDVESGEKMREMLGSTVWVLREDQIVSLLTSLKDRFVVSSLVQEAAIRNMSVSKELFMSLLSQLNENNVNSFSRLANSIDFDSVSVATLLKARQSTVFPILTVAASKKKELAQTLATDVTDSIDDIIVSADGLVFLNVLSKQVPEFGEMLYPKVVEAVRQIVLSKSFDNAKLKVLLAILSQSSSHPQNEDGRIVEKLLELPAFSNEASLVFSREFEGLLVKFGDLIEKSKIRLWLQRAALYTTQMFSECKGEKLPAQFVDFLIAMETVLREFPIWKYVPKGVVNSQIEGILATKWIRNTEVLRYVIRVLCAGSGHLIEATRVLQIFINNECNGLRNSATDRETLQIRFYSALIIHRLVENEPKSLASVDVMLSIVKFHTATIFPDDSILRLVMSRLEECLGVSWINYVVDWELRESNDDDDDANDTDVRSKYASDDCLFVESSPSSLQDLRVIIRKSIVDQTISHFSETQSVSLPHPESDEGFLTAWVGYFEEFGAGLGSKILKSEFRYDSGFLMLALLNNDELFKFQEDRLKVSVRALVESGMLQLIVVNLVNAKNHVRHIARKLAGAIFATLDEQMKEMEKHNSEKEIEKYHSEKEKLQKYHSEKDESAKETPKFRPYKERAIFKLFLGNLLNTMDDAETKSEDSGSNESHENDVAPIVFVFLSHLVPILMNPGHFMYEKAYRYLLGAPQFRTYEVPFFKAVMCLFTKDQHASAESDNSEDYYRRLHWFLSTLKESITCPADFRIIRKGSFLETLLMLVHSPFLYMRTQGLITDVLLKLVGVANGADTLIRSSGLLSFLEQYCNELRSSKKLLDHHPNAKARKNFLLLEYQRVAIEAELSSSCNGSNKRALEWTGGDLPNSVKRIMRD